MVFFAKIAIKSDNSKLLLNVVFMTTLYYLCNNNLLSMITKILFTLAALCFGLVMDNHTVAATLPKRVKLQAYSADAEHFAVNAPRERVVVTSAEQWMGVVGDSVSVESGERRDVALWVEPNLSTNRRSGTITVTGEVSGTVTNIEVVQYPYFNTGVDGFPARWEMQSCNLDRWESEGLCTTEDGEALLAVVCRGDREPSFTRKGGATVAGMAAGDYLLYAVPTTGVAAGTQFDFMCTISGIDPTSPKYWIFEYWDNGRWNSVDRGLQVADKEGVKYSFYTKYFPSLHHTTFTQSFTLSQAVTDGSVRVRLRALTSGDGRIRIPASNGYMGSWLVDYRDAPRVKDSNRVLFIGNSFTYFYGTPFMFKEIARSEGHQVDAVVSVKGGQEFCEHLKLERSIEAITRGGYNYAFLQDTSPNPAIYASTERADILEACREINALTLKHSPECKIIYESTWSCPYKNYRGYGSHQELERLITLGNKMLVERLGEDIVISPIWDGFRRGRKANLELLFEDNRHQSRVGAYMKSCINYLTIYQTPFSENVSDCGLDSQTAKIIREIAQGVVLGK